MGEYKFRAWDKEEGEMFEFNLLDNEGYNKVIGTMPLDETQIFMQYTGLKDKNGKDIYQDDLVKYPNNTIEGYGIYQVESLLNFGYYILHKNITDKLEIIGNIYENPELIK